MPEWLAPHLERVFACRLGRRGRGAGAPPAARYARQSPEEPIAPEVAKALARFGAVETPFSPDGLRIAPTTGEGRHPNVQVEPAFQKGWFEVQDEGSQIAALMVGAKAGEQILDLCAGAGGKTLALAAAMGNKGQIFATDSDRGRLAPIFDRLQPRRDPECAGPRGRRRRSTTWPGTWTRC